MSIKSPNSSRLQVVYILSIMGDLAYSLLLTASVIYGTHLGGTQSQTGLIGGAYGITYLITPLILGKIGDRIPRKTSLIIACFSQILCGLYHVFLVKTIFDLILGQIFIGMAFGFYWTSIEAYISENTHESPEKHQQGMANFCISWSIGFMIGPLLGGILSDYNVMYSFIIVLVTYTAGFFLVLFGIKNGKSILKNEVSKEDIEQSQKIAEGSINPTADSKDSNTLIMIRLLFGMLIYALIVKIILTYFTDYAVRPQLLNWSGTTTGQIIFIFGLGRTTYFLLGRFSKNTIFKSSLNKIAFSFALLGTLLIFIPMIKIPIGMGILFFIFGFFVGLIYLSSLDLLIVQEKESKGAKAGLFESTIGFGAIVSPYLAGILGEIQPDLPFYVFALLVICVFVMNLALKRIQYKKKNKIIV